MDKEQLKKQLMKETVESEGWKYIKEIIDEEINRATIKLLNNTKPDETIKIAQLQQTIKCFQAFNNKIKKYTT